MRTRTIFRVTAEQSKQRQKRVCLRRTRVQIEFYIGSHPATFPHNSNSEKENHQTYAVAPCGRDILHGTGYGHGILILLFLPVLWCLPTAFMIGELSSALPEEGGYYAWVRRGLGNLWGFQEAWLSLAASIFDMAIYPTLFVFYLKQMSPWFGA